MIKECIQSLYSVCSRVKMAQKLHDSLVKDLLGFQNLTGLKNHPRLLLIELGLNVGFGTQNSMGIGYCKGWHEQNGGRHHLNS